MTETVGTLGVELKAEIDQFSKKLDEASKSIEDFGKGAETAGKTTAASFSLAVAAGSILASATMKAMGAVQDFFRESISLGLQYEQSFAVLTRRAGSSAGELVAELHEASKGNLSNLQAVQAMNKAFAFGLTNSQLIPLLEVATAKGRMMGISTSEAFDNIIMGVGRMRTALLTTTGIVLDEQEAFDAYSLSVYGTIQPLTDMEKRLALVQGIIRSSTDDVRTFGGELDTAAEKMDAWNNRITDYKMNIGTAFVVGLESLFEAVGVIKEVDDAVDKGGEASEALIGRLKDAGVEFNKNTGYIRTNSENLGKAYDVLKAYHAELEVGQQVNQGVLQTGQAMLNLNSEGLTVDEVRIRNAQTIRDLTILLNEEVAKGIPDVASYMQKQDELNRVLEKSDSTTKSLAASWLAARAALKGLKSEADDTKRSIRDMMDLLGRGKEDSGIAAYYLAQQGLLSKKEEATYGYKNQPRKQGDFLMRPGQAPVAFDSGDTVIGFQEGNLPRIGGGEPIIVESNLILDGQQIYRATQRVFQDEFLRRSG